MKYLHKRRFPVRYRSAVHRGKRRRKIIAIVVIFALLWCCISEWGLSSLSKELVEEAARNYLIASMNRAIEEECGLQENGPLSVNKSGGNEISAFSVDCTALNQMKTGVAQRLFKLLNGRVTLRVPIGSLTDVGILNGRGPGIPLKLNFAGASDVTFQTDLESAGVNQSCYRVVMKVSASLHSQSRRFEVRAEETTSAVVVETLVIGEVPNVAFSGKY